MKYFTSLFHLAAFFVISAILFTPCETKGQSKYIPDSLKYLGQTPPGIVPVRFPPAYLLADSSWFWHGPVTFSPGLEEMYWGEHIIQGQKGKIFYMNFFNGQWSGPNQANFTQDNESYNNPFFTSSNDTLWFQSFKPGGFIFYSTWLSYYWSEPVPLALPVPPGKSPGLQFSFDQNRDIYGELDEGATDINIYCWNRVNGNYNSPEKLDTVINTPYIDFCPFIDPDGHFLLFSSNRPGGFGGFDLYLSNHGAEGTWSAPVNLGNTINTSSDEWAPSITPDGLYVFFLSLRTDDLGYNPYWVSAEVINQLVGINDPDRQNNDLPVTLYQNSPNPFRESTSIRYSLLCEGFVSLKVYNGTGVAVATLVNEKQAAGNHEIFFVATDLAEGIYPYSLQVNGVVLHRNMIRIIK